LTGGWGLIHDRSVGIYIAGNISIRGLHSLLLWVYKQEQDQFRTEMMCIGSTFITVWCLSIGMAFFLSSKTIQKCSNIGARNFLNG